MLSGHIVGDFVGTIVASRVGVPGGEFPHSGLGELRVGIWEKEPGPMAQVKWPKPSRPDTEAQGPRGRPCAAVLKIRRSSSW